MVAVFAELFAGASGVVLCWVVAEADVAAIDDLDCCVVVTLAVVLLADVVEDAEWLVVVGPSLVDVDFCVVVASEYVVEA